MYFKATSLAGQAAANLLPVADPNCMQQQQLWSTSMLMLTFAGVSNTCHEDGRHRLQLTFSNATLTLTVAQARGSVERLGHHIPGILT